MRRRIVTWLCLGCSTLVLCGCFRKEETGSRGAGATSAPTGSSSVVAPSAAEAVVDRRDEIASLVHSAETAIQSGDMQTARRHLQSVLIQDANHAQASFLSAMVAAGAGDLGSAIEILKNIPTDHPEFGIAALGQTAQWLEELGHVYEARNAYRELIQRAPEFEPAKHEFARFLNSVGWRYEARDVLEPLVRDRTATEAELRALLSLSSSYAETQQGADGLPSVNRQGPLGVAMGALSNRSPQQCLQTLAQSPFATVADPAVDAVTAAALVELQRFEEFEELISGADAEIQGFPQYWQAIGDRARMTGDHRNAVGAYLRALQIDSTNTITHERLMSALLGTSNVEEARLVDDRRALLLSVAEAASAIGAGNPDDLRAGSDLVSDLEKLGEPYQAMAWMDLIASRHPSSALSADYDLHVARLKGYSTEEMERRRLSGLSLETYPSGGGLTAVARSDDSRDRAASSPAKSISAAAFVNVANSMKLIHQYQNAADPRERNLKIFQSLGAGAAAIDYDLDGFVDFYFGQGAGDPPANQASKSNLMFRHLGDRFVEVQNVAGTSDYGYSAGITAGDVNQDGFPDLAIGCLGKNRLLLNQGDGTFRDVSAEIGWDEIHYTMGLAIADLTGDAIPDVVEVNYVNEQAMYEPLEIGSNGYALSFPGPLHFRAEQDRVWVSAGDGSLHATPLGTRSAPDANSAAIGDAANPGLGLVVTNLDNEPGLEIFVANDARPNQLWKRNSLGTNQDPSSPPLGFTDIAVLKGCAFSSRGEACACMGVANADFDRNGLVDLFISNWVDEWVNLYLQQSGGYFRDSAPVWGLDKLSEGLLGFGSQSIDYDNDGDVDLIVANGHIDDMPGSQEAFEMPTQLLVNLGDRFELAKVAGDSYWETSHLGRCVISCDHNFDGRLDAVVVDLKEPVVLLENRTETANQWLQLRLVGVDSERDAIGARVEVSTAGFTQTSVLATGDGYQGRNEAILSFGLGDEAGPVSVSVEWPSGERSTWDNVPASHRYLVVELEPEIWREAR